MFGTPAMRMSSKLTVRIWMVILEKTGNQIHERKVNNILPEHLRSFCLVEKVKTLKLLYGHQLSLLDDRYKCFQYIDNDADHFSSYAPTGNKHFEAFQLYTLSDNQLKTLRFVGGLQSPRGADIRTRIIEFFENTPPAVGSKITLETLAEACHRFNNMKQDMNMIEELVL